jgi:hypothetical protein
VTRTAASAPPAGQTYCLEFRGAGGALLQRNCFDLLMEWDGAEEARGMTPFDFTLPWPDGATSVQLKAGQTALDQVAASAHAPAVTLLAPNGGETWTGSQTVRWTASDDDGDPLAFAVLYSRDGGASWTPLTTGLTRPSTLWTRAAWPTARVAWSMCGPLTGSTRPRMSRMASSPCRAALRPRPSRCRRWGSHIWSATR